MPERFRRFGETWETMHPTWRRRLWTEVDVDSLSSFRTRKAFERATTFAGKADILRYEILHEFGGVYVDTDFECLKNCESLFAGASAFVSENAISKPDYACNGFMGATPRHPFIEDLIVAIEARFDPRRKPHASTGPRLISRILLRYPEVRVLPKNRLYRMDWKGSPIDDPRFLFADHHWRGLEG